MDILFHCGAGNTDRPSRWSTINKLFLDFGESLIKLGHSATMIVHSQARIPQNNTSKVKCIVCDTINPEQIKNIKHDVAITWNGNSDGDKKFIEVVGKEKMVYGELGFFGHYDKTCYFNECGVNTRHSIIGKRFPQLTLEQQETVNTLKQDYIKPRLFQNNYIFVPLQDEQDTQILQYSPFKTMDEFLHTVFDIFRWSNITILYKKHPLADCKITVSDPRVIEVKENVHHYLPYADFVFGLNSTVTVETLLYHSRLITYGAGISARHFSCESARESFIYNLYNNQLTWDELANPDKIKNTEIYEHMISVASNNKQSQYTDLINNIKKYKKILITGPQRSGTTFAAYSIAKSLNYRLVDELEYSNDLKTLGYHLKARNTLVVQAPAQSHIIHEMDTFDLIIFMHRNVSDIIKSQERINWPQRFEDEEKNKYIKTFPDIDEEFFKNNTIADIKYKIFDTYQKQNLKCDLLEINYVDLESSPYFIKKENRKNFTSKQVTR